MKWPLYVWNKENERKPALHNGENIFTQFKTKAEENDFVILDKIVLSFY